MTKQLALRDPLVAIVRAARADEHLVGAQTADDQVHRVRDFNLEPPLKGCQPLRGRGRFESAGQASLLFGDGSLACYIFRNLELNSRISR